MILRFAAPAALLAFCLAWAPAPGAVADPAPRAVVVELFGSMDCSDCSETRAALGLLEADLGRSSVIGIEYHAASPIANSLSSDRFTYYGNPIEPTALFDGDNPVVGSDGSLLTAYRARIDALLATPTPLGIEAIYLFDTETGRGEISIDVGVTVGELVPDPEAWTVRTYVVEDAVTACCGAGGVDRWDRIPHIALPEEPLIVSTGGQERRIEYDFALDPDWNLDRLGAVIFVQRDSDGAILNAYRALDGLSLQPLPVTPIDESGARLHASVPNPLRSESRITFTMPAGGRARLTIHDGSGRLVRVLTDDIRPTGLHPLFWDGTDWRGDRMANGVYFVRLQTTRGADSGKLIVIR